MKFNLNLLLDSWIPVNTKAGKIIQISLEELLCNKEHKGYEIICHRDDMQVAVLQLIICLVQSVFLIKDSELKNYINNPISAKEYQKKIKPYVDWFNLRDVKQPFLQTNSVNTKDIVPIQKLFNGLPEGNNHTWHYDPNSRIDKICSSCAAIMLFNQSTNSPSFGGGFKNPLRGATPLTTLIKGKNLRETIWLNILTEEFLSKSYGKLDKLINVPNWVLKVNKDSEVSGKDIGLIRGLFWQPAVVELVWQDGNANANCDSCSTTSELMAVGFRRQSFTYKFTSDFLHPHSPRYFLRKDGETKEIYQSYKDLPWWTQVINLVMDRDNGAPALVVNQYKELFPEKELSLMISGYNNNQAKITQRSYLTFSLPTNWLQNRKYIESHLNLALEIASILRKKGYGIGKSVGLDLLPGDSLSNLLTDLQKSYYQAIEPLMIDFVSDISNYVNINSNMDKGNTEAKDINENLKEALTTVADKHLTDFANDYQLNANFSTSLKQAIDLTVEKLIANA